MRIRRANMDDARAVFELHGRTVREICGRDYTPDEIEAWLRKQSVAAYRERIAEGDMYVAEGDDGAILGFAARAGDRVKTLYVSADHQSEGVGSALLGRLEEDALDEGIAEVSAHATVTALGFYERQGYEIGERVDCPVTREIPLTAFAVRKRLA
ncbi:MAG: GNAT family N-acetyltransferase [Gemmatimonadetes bacterium]|nr:GNAT family N-acetyltransferase [Gemmatimonadota bacterium]